MKVNVRLKCEGPITVEVPDNADNLEDLATQPSVRFWREAFVLSSSRARSCDAIVNRRHKTLPVQVPARQEVAPRSEPRVQIGRFLECDGRLGEFVEFVLAVVETADDGEEVEIVAHVNEYGDWMWSGPPS
jgi:hypothetical protein